MTNTYTPIRVFNKAQILMEVCMEPVVCLTLIQKLSSDARYCERKACTIWYGLIKLSVECDPVLTDLLPEQLLEMHVFGLACRRAHTVQWRCNWQFDFTESSRNMTFVKVVHHVDFWTVAAPGHPWRAPARALASRPIDELSIVLLNYYWGVNKPLSPFRNFHHV